MVAQPVEDAAILVTHYLERSWQYRRLLMRVPASQRVHRARLFDAMAVLLVDLHRNGIYWGDCSLANTLFMRDGQIIQAWLVDAETAEFHPTLTRRAAPPTTWRSWSRTSPAACSTSRAPRGAARGPRRPSFDEAAASPSATTQLWDLLHDEPVVGPGRPVPRSTGAAAQLNEMGFAVDEIRLEPAGEPTDQLRMRVAVAGRRFHSDQLRALTGLDVGEGQATILLNDLRAYHAALQRRSSREVTEDEAARHWLDDVFDPGVDRPTAPSVEVGATRRRPTATCSRCAGC